MKQYLFSRRRPLAPRAALTIALSMMALVGCAIQSGSARPSANAPSPSPSPSSSSCPGDPSPSVLVQGCAILRNHDSLDLDQGRVGTSTPDLTIRDGMVLLAPGTTAAYLGPTKYTALTPNTIAQAHLGTSSFDMLLLERNGVFAIRTGTGHPAKVLIRAIDQVSSTLDLALVTYQGPLSAPDAPTNPTPTHPPTRSPTHSPTASPTPTISPSP